MERVTACNTSSSSATTQSCYFNSGFQFLQRLTDVLVIRNSRTGEGTEVGVILGLTQQGHDVVDVRLVRINVCLNGLLSRNVIGTIGCHIVFVFDGDGQLTRGELQVGVVSGGRVDEDIERVRRIGVDAIDRLGAGCNDVTLISTLSIVTVSVDGLFVRTVQVGGVRGDATEDIPGTTKSITGKDSVGVVGVLLVEYTVSRRTSGVQNDLGVTTEVNVTIDVST